MMMSMMMTIMLVETEYDSFTQYICVYVYVYICKTVKDDVMHHEMTNFMLSVSNLKYFGCDTPFLSSPEISSDILPHNLCGLVIELTENVKIDLDKFTQMCLWSPKLWEVIITCPSWSLEWDFDNILYVTVLCASYPLSNCVVCCIHNNRIVCYRPTIIVCLQIKSVHQIVYGDYEPLRGGEADFKKFKDEISKLTINRDVKIVTHEENIEFFELLTQNNVSVSSDRLINPHLHSDTVQPYFDVTTFSCEDLYYTFRHRSSFNTKLHYPSDYGCGYN